MHAHLNDLIDLIRNILLLLLLFSTRYIFDTTDKTIATIATIRTFRTITTMAEPNRLVELLGQLVDLHDNADFAQGRIQQIVLNLCQERNALRAEVQRLQTENQMLRQQVSILSARPQSSDYDRYDSGSEGL